VIYVASKSKWAHWWRALRAAGVPIVAPWIDATLNAPGADEPDADIWSRHWETCLTSAAAADVCLFYAEEGSTQCGALIELGAALAAGKQCFIVSPYEWTIAHHPRCRVFPTLADAVEAILSRGRITKHRGRITEQGHQNRGV